MTDLQDREAIARFRALVDDEPVLQMALARHTEPEAFVAEALGVAERHGLPLRRDDLGPAAHADALGVARMTTAATLIDRWPSAGWLPVDLVRLADGTIAVDWAHFAGAPMAEPFFAGALRRALARPFNRWFRLCTPLDVFIAGGQRGAGRPNGLIFHMSRSGSTLVARMFAAVPDSLVLSEAAPLDALVRLAMAEDWPEDRAIAALAAMVAAFDRTRPQGALYVIKLHCWHALALSRFEAAFPRVPWIFLYREPAEVLASQLWERGPELEPALMHPAWYGLEPDPDMAPEAYCARALARVCEVAADALADGRGLAVDYARLPEAVGSVIADHFGLRLGAAERAAMIEASRAEAKAPGRVFDPKARHEPSAAAREAADLYLRPSINRLARP